ncbi:MOSC domain-containing protein YiiM [Actinoplanes tereljensis]|uniref:MOSC domain-containing protein n=1 Tax=Paractinoplanes tereljensis TaxID=571912 RepID=A0A919TQI6_9ACTN|nr:MOSC domain-containing protein [Actinoplanes tereljensis]GIF18199.1 hypothetical protein Ate02nite_09290 [Actinoplanes tereljensis]
MATLRSVNVGMPKNVLWQGRSVYTGIWKAPVEGPATVRRLNIDGDGQGDLGGHGGEQRAVFVYQLDSYRYWQKFLDRDDFTPGQFGENFTVDGLPDDEVCIGDRYRIGTALFEVTQPRVTCYRVGIRMDDPRMPALLVQHRRPGFYFRVLREGEVRAGDEITKVADGPEGMTVAEVDGLLYRPGHPRDRIERALHIPALSPGWQGSFRAMLAEPASASGNAGLIAAVPPPAWPGFRPLRVTAVNPESNTITSVRLADPAGGPLPAALPGQFLTVRLPQALTRSYSLSGRPGDPEYQISVKQEPHGYLPEPSRSGRPARHRLRQRGPIYGRPTPYARIAGRCRRVPLRSAGLSHRRRRRAGRGRPAGRPDPHRDLRPRARPDPRHQREAEPRTASAGRRPRRRPADVVRPQRPDRPVAHRLQQPARPGRDVRRPGSLVLPHRRLPQLRNGPALRRGALQPRPDRPTGRRQRPDLLHTAAHRRHPRPLTARQTPSRIR